MIHHLARAFFVRDAAAQQAHLLHANTPGGQNGGDQSASASASNPVVRPIKPRPITPWSVPARPGTAGEGRGKPGDAQASLAATRRVRISTDPSDARRTVIAGRFAEVCAALDRLVREQEAVA